MFTVLPLFPISCPQPARHTPLRSTHQRRDKLAVPSRSLSNPTRVSEYYGEWPLTWPADGSHNNPLRGTCQPLRAGIMSFMYTSMLFPTSGVMYPYQGMLNRERENIFRTISQVIPVSYVDRWSGAGTTGEIRTRTKSRQASQIQISYLIEEEKST